MPFGFPWLAALWLQVIWYNRRVVKLPEMSNGAQSERESEAGGEKVGRETLGQMLDEADEPLTWKDWLGARQRQEIRIWPASTTPTCVYCRATSSYSLGEHRTIINHRLIKTGSCESGFTAEGRASVPVHPSVRSICLALEPHGKTQRWTGGRRFDKCRGQSLPPSSRSLFKDSHFYHMSVITIRYQRHHRA